MMYCLRTVKELAQSTGAEDFMGCMSISLSILSACGEHWASAKRSREVLNGLAKSTLSWLKSVKTISGNNNDAAPGLIPEDSGNLPSLPTPLGHPAEMQALESLWPCQNSQDLFSDTTNVDDIMRSLFDGFLPQVDNFDVLQSL